MHRLIEYIIWLLAVYGLFTLLLGAAGLIRCRILEKRTRVRVVLLLQDAEEQIEYIIRNAVKKDFASKVLSDKKIVIVDMNSTDKTSLLLEKLQNDFSNIETVTFEHREQIFDDFSIFPPSSN